MKKAILKNLLNGVEVEVMATTDHPASSYGQAVWADANGEAYAQVGMEAFYEITALWEIDSLEGLARYINDHESYPYDVEDIIEAKGWELPDLSDETHIARDGQRLLYINEQGNAVIIDNYFGQWYIVMNTGCGESYVLTTEDIRTGGVVDAHPRDFGIPTEEEAKRIMAELEAYCQENGINCSFYCYQEQL